MCVCACMRACVRACVHADLLDLWYVRACVCENTIFFLLSVFFSIFLFYYFFFFLSLWSVSSLSLLLLSSALPMSLLVFSVVAVGSGLSFP